MRTFCCAHTIESIPLADSHIRCPKPGIPATGGVLSMSTPYNLGENLSAEVKSRSGWGIFMGVLTAALGVLLMAYPLATATAFTILLGCILVVVGVIEIVQALRSHTVGSFFLRLLLGVVYGIGGIVLLVYPLWGVAVLTSVLGFMLLFEAIFETVLAFQVRPASGW